MTLNIEIYALLPFVACLYCSVKESNTRSDFEIFKNTYYENINKKFEDDHSIYITLSCSELVPYDIKKWDETHVFYLGFRLAKEEMIEYELPDRYYGYVEGLDYSDEKRIIIPDEIIKEFYVEMKKKRKNSGNIPRFNGECCDNREIYVLDVYLKRKEAKILVEMIEKYYNGLLTNEFVNVSNPLLE